MDMIATTVDIGRSFRGLETGLQGIARLLRTSPAKSDTAPHSGPGRLPQLIAATPQVGGLRAVARQLDGLFVRRARLMSAAQPAQQVGAGCMVGVIAGQRLLKTVDARKRRFRTVSLGHRDGSVEGDDGRRVEADELVVECDDLRPVGVARFGRERVHGVDCGEDLVATRRHAGGQTLAHQLMALGDQRRIPGPTVLLGKGCQFAARRKPGRAAGLDEQHQRQESGDLTVLRQEDTDEATKADRFGGQLPTYGLGVGAGRQVALIEDEEEDGKDARDASRKLLRGRHPIRDARRSDLVLRARDPLPHGDLLHQEGAGDLGHGQAADHSQRERDAVLHRERRVTAGEDQPKPLVVDVVAGVHRAVGDEWLRRVVAIQQVGRRLLVVALALTPEPVDGFAGGGGGQPCAGIGGYAVERPPPDGGRERLSCRFLGDVEVAEAPGQSSDHPCPLLVVSLRDRLPNVDHAQPGRNGRTSTFRLQCFEPSAASLRATSRSGASMTQKPMRYSFDSTKGPSLKTASPPRLSMTVAVLGEPRPPAKTQWPSARSRSLNASMAAISSEVARPALSSITETRYFISTHLLCVGRSWAGAHPYYEYGRPDPTSPPLPFQAAPALRQRHALVKRRLGCPGLHADARGERSP